MATPLPSKDVPSRVSKTASDMSDIESRAVQCKVEFLSSFTQEEHKSIMHKVDKRFLPLIGMMLLIKAVSIFRPDPGDLCSPRLA